MPLLTRCRAEVFSETVGLERHFLYRALVDLSFLPDQGSDGDIFLFGVP
jgi:hypothetical protein